MDREEVQEWLRYFDTETPSESIGKYIVACLHRIANVLEDVKSEGDFERDPALRVRGAE